MKNTALLKASVMMILLVLSAGLSQCQGTMQPLLITFDGPPVVEPGTTYTSGNYEEAGMLFIMGFGATTRRGSDPGPEWPDNGSAYLINGGQSLRFTNGMAFGLLSVDVAEFNVADTNTTFSFVGHRQDGDVVTTNFTADGVIDGTGSIADFETFVFGPEFSNLTSASVGFAFGSIDNLVVAVPEPSAVALLLVGGGFFVGLYTRRRTRSIKRGWS